MLFLYFPSYKARYKDVGDDDNDDDVSLLPSYPLLPSLSLHSPVFFSPYQYCWESITHLGYINVLAMNVTLILLTLMTMFGVVVNADGDEDNANVMSRVYLWASRAGFPALRCTAQLHSSCKTKQQPSLLLVLLVSFCHRKRPCTMTSCEKNPRKIPFFFGSRASTRRMDSTRSSMQHRQLSCVRSTMLCNAMPLVPNES